MLKKVTTLKMLLFSVTVVRRVVEMIALAVTQEVVKVIAKTESDLVRSPCETKHHVQLTACTYFNITTCYISGVMLHQCS